MLLEAKLLRSPSPTSADPSPTTKLTERTGQYRTEAQSPVEPLRTCTPSHHRLFLPVFTFHNVKNPAKLLDGPKQLSQGRGGGVLQQMVSSTSQAQLLTGIND